MFNQGRIKYRKQEAECKCGHPRICHYTQEGNCVYQACECKAYGPKGRETFKNKRAHCEYNHAHDSGLETRLCAEFHYQKLARAIKDYRAQVVVDLPGPSGHVIAKYKVDFIVEHNDGSIEYVEAKGYHIRNLQPWPIKWSLLQDKHRGDPKYRFRVVMS